MSDKRSIWLPKALAAAGALASSVYAFLIRPQLLKAGARLGEPGRRMPGDDLIPEPTSQATYGMDIDARPEDVWPWLLHVLRPAPGLFTYELNPSSTSTPLETPPDTLRDPEPGDRYANELRVASVEMGRVLVLKGFELVNEFASRSAMTLAYLTEGHPGKTRLICRTRIRSYGLLGKLYDIFFFEVANAIASRRQLAEIKRRAEHWHHIREAT